VSVPRRFFARGSSTHPFGKCDTELKTQVPERLKDELTALAVFRGQTPSEYLRDLITVHLHGHLDVARVTQGDSEG